MINKRKIKILLPIFAIFGIFLIVGNVFAQVDPGFVFGEELGLGTEDIRVTIARIIRIALGALGIIAVVAIIAGGVVYMTAGGDAKRIDIAKKIMINSVIGLAIILSAFGITQFVLNSLVDATTRAPSGVEGPPGPGPGFGPTAFTLRGITPSGAIPIRNVTVRATFNSGVDGATVPDNFTVTRVSDGIVAEGTIVVARNTIEFTPVANCPAPNEDRKCFDSDTEYRVNLTGDIRNLAGQSLVCGGFAPVCEGLFTTGSLVDVSGPTVSVTVPDVDESISADSLVSLEAVAVDDAGIAQIEFYIDGLFVDVDAPSDRTLLTYTGSAVWDTTGVLLGRHSVSAIAYDIDTNETVSSGISVYVRAAHCFNGVIDADEGGVDCGGADCGSCEGGTCSVDADCASGVCREGACVSVPRIDAVYPGDGREGNYISIIGEFFGDSMGEVSFLGGAGVEDDIVAPFASCSTAWQSNQVIVEVPVGAVDGPIELRASSGEFDTTNNERGAFIDDFDVNDIARPGICEISPQSGVSGDAISISGAQFGMSEEGNSALLSGRDIFPTSWGNELISGTVPSVSTGRHPVYVLVGGEPSNPVYFNAVSRDAGTVPSITYVDPTSGPREEYLTIYGSNFGRSMGRIIFRNFVSGDEANALTNFPAACGDDFWHDNSVTVKVPLRYLDDITDITEGVHLVRVVRADGVESAPIEFLVEEGIAGPGICRINPDNGPALTSVTVSGERFGRDTGDLRFWENQFTAINSWDDQQILAVVPSLAITGSVSAIVDAQESNGVNFSVSNCLVSGCALGEECCDSGVCISEGDECVGGPRAGGFAWRFSTGIIPFVPRVVEECREGASPSPSPWDARRGGNEVCVNAAINVRFTTEMDLATLVSGNINAYQCVAEGDSPCLEIAPISGRIDAYADGFTFVPLIEFAPSSRYYITLTTGLRGFGEYGDYMEEDADKCGLGNAYCFSFGTRADDDPCEVGNVTVNPSSATISVQSETKDYMSSAISRGDICVALNSDAYGWSWNVSDTLRASVTNDDLVGGGADGTDPDGNIDASQVATALSETLPGTPVKVYADIASEHVSDYGELTINFTDPEIISRWPDCASACVNSEIGVEFNTAIDSATVLMPGNFIVYECSNESCRRFVGGVSGTVDYNSEEKIATFNHSGLDESTYYRVVIKGGTSGIKSDSGVVLINTNYGESNVDYSWIFRTRDSDMPCAISSVDLRPDYAVLDFVGETQTYTAVALGAPDECSERGQRLQSMSYNWAWVSTDTDVADFVRVRGDLLDVLPRVGSEGCANMCLHTGTSSGVSVCGNRIVESGEDCDDGNTRDEDGCSSICLNEGSIFGGSTCGNARVEVGEDCDDGNISDFDGCSAFCLNEGSIFGNSQCGSGDIGDGEDCDDGNTRGGDGCSRECLNEGSFTGPLAICGNSVLENGEDCDDGNLDVGDGCNRICLNEGTNRCENPSEDFNCCGNARIESGEDCDDGNNTSGDGCDSRCLKEGSNLAYGSICGNAVVADDLEIGEECEFAGANDTNTDPIQYAEATLEGETIISATANSISDEGTLRVACVCERDLMCVFPPPAPSNLGCGSDGCCSARPEVASSLPTGVGICRNALISVEFNMLMDSGTFNENFEVVARPLRLPWFTGDPMFIPIDPCPVGELSDDELWCKIPGAIKTTNEEGRTILRFSPAEAFVGNSNYSVRIKGDRNLLDDVSEGVLNTKGIGLTEGLIDGYYMWSFSTGPHICTIDEIELTPNPLVFLSVGDKSNVAHAYSRIESGRQEITRIPDVYNWEWSWGINNERLASITNTDSDTQTVSVPPAIRKGETIATSIALITTDTVSQISTSGREIKGESEIIILVCNNPWPARNSDGSWAPYEILGDGNNFRFYYCRDVGDIETTEDDLPAINVNPVLSPPLANILSEFLIPVTCPTDSVTCKRGDAMGIRVMMNNDHYSPAKWYNLNGFSGSPIETFIDGYPAVQDSRTVYVNAANMSYQHIYTNMYILSYTQNAGADTMEIYNQILENISFTRALPGLHELDSDEKDALRRDVKRLADIRDIEESLITYGRLHKFCNVSQDIACGTDTDCPGSELCSYIYPKLESGSFLQYFTNSKWPSWQVALGSELGMSMPQDPVNQFGECPEGYNSETCYNADALTYMCPTGSYVYSYQNCLGNNYNLSFNLEYTGGFWVIDKLFEGNYSLTPSYCRGEVLNNESVCTMDRGTPGEFSSAPAGCGNGILEIDSGEVCDDGLLNGSYNHCSITCSGWGAYCGDNIVQRSPFGPEVCDLGVLNGNYGSACSWDCRKPLGPHCGDGEINGSEECEFGDTEIDSVSCIGALIDGYATQKTRNCASDCMWPDWSSISCAQVGSCGNGLVDGAGEQCDDGNLSDSDGCVNTCQNARCGDGFVRTGYEQCDLGDAINGDICIPSPGLMCTYCSSACTLLTISGD
ncbi:MAG: Ig-like domain-containing protein [Patescibacteria group bacterium]|nr:Ig-like domain-containing protein [Patescibacteria group bacterium]